MLRLIDARSVHPEDLHASFRLVVAKREGSSRVLDSRQRLGQEMRAAHPSLQRPEGMFDGFRRRILDARGLRSGRLCITSRTS